MDGSPPEGSGAQDGAQDGTQDGAQDGAEAAGAGRSAEAVTGQGASADGLISATVTEQGRVERVELSPDLLRSAQGGAIDTGPVGDGIATAVNAAMDDLAAKLRTGASDGFDGLEAKLDEVTAGFERALGKVAEDLERAQKRLEEA